MADFQRVTAADLLTAWRDAALAAELASRLADEASAVADEAEADAEANERLADLALEASEAAAHAATEAPLREEGEEPRGGGPRDAGAAGAEQRRWAIECEAEAR